MKKSTTILIFLLLFLSIPSPCLSLEVTALVSEDKISRSDSIIFRITVKGGKGKIDTSVIKDFRVVPQGSSTSVSIINTKYSKTISYTYLLFPLRVGTLTIPEIKIIDGDKTSTTQAITIIVSEEPTNDTVSNTFFAKASVLDKTIFPGQDTIYTFKLFAAASFYDAKLSEPGFQQFSVKKLEKNDHYTQNINGKMYTVNELSYIISPVKPGNFTIEPATVTMQIPAQENNTNQFGFDSLFQTRKVVKHIISNKVSIKVNPLPPYDGEENFTGLIGDFTIKAKINKTELFVGESTTLTVTISGRGNIMDTSINNINLPKESFKIYDDKPVKEEKITNKGYFKKKIFKKAIVPTKSGSFVIPTISFCYFDTTMEHYKTIATKPIDIKVTKSAIAEETSFQAEDKKIEKTEVDFTGKDILPLKQGSDVLKLKKNISFYFFSSMLILPFILFCLIKFFTSFQKREKPNSIIMKQKATLALKKANNSKLSHEEFLKHIHTAVISTVLSKGNTAGESLTKTEIHKILQKANIKDKDIKETLTTLNHIESAKYSGITLEKDSRQNLLLRVKKLMKICLSIALVISICSFTPLDKAFADKSGTLFLEAVKNYEAGNFKKASFQFEKIALTSINNGKLYYNTGNAFLKAGNIGKAVLWYERAKKIIPLDADLQFNLNYTQEKLKDIKKPEPFNLTDILFILLNYFSSNQIRYFAVFLCCLFFLHASIKVLKQKKIFTTSGSTVFFLFLIVLSTALFDYYNTVNSNSAVIIPEQISVRSGLSEDSTELFVLHAGTKVKVDRQKNGFIRVVFSKGKLGWIKQDNAIII